MTPLALAFVLLLSPGSGPTQPQDSCPSSNPTTLVEPLPVEIRNLLLASSFGELTDCLEQKQAAFEKSVTEEDALWEAFLSFSVPDLLMEPLLDDWVRSSPDSWVAHLARGVYFDKVAWAERGGGWISEVSKKRIERMSSYLEKAEADFRAALRGNDRLMIAYAGLIGIGKSRGDRAMVRQAYDKAIAKAPACFIIRASYMHSLKPRWGGSYAEMREAAAEAQEHVGENGRLRALSGYVAVDQADLAVRAGDDQAAVALLSQAISSAEDPVFLSERGAIYLRTHRYSEALNDFERALALHPHGWWYGSVRLAKTLFYKGECLYRLGKTDQALADVDRAERLDPADGEISEWARFLRRRCGAKRR